MELTLQIICEDLAGIDFRSLDKNNPGEGMYYLGIQKDKEVIDTVPVTAGTATFTALLQVSPLPNGKPNFLGPYAHGTRDERFCYLTWLREDKTGHMSMLGRVKLHLSPLAWERVEEAVQAEKPISMRLSLLGKGGRPVCASISNDAIQWDE